MALDRWAWERAGRCLILQAPSWALLEEPALAPWVSGVQEAVGLAGVEGPDTVLGVEGEVSTGQGVAAAVVHCCRRRCIDRSLPLRTTTAFFARRRGTAHGIELSERGDKRVS